MFEHDLRALHQPIPTDDGMVCFQDREEFPCEYWLVAAVVEAARAVVGDYAGYDHAALGAALEALDTKEETR